MNNFECVIPSMCLIAIKTLIEQLIHTNNKVKRKGDDILYSIVYVNVI